ncbi:MAG: formate dehydrogenase accessory protein FdhE [Dokdonella sp.]|uniref:formate dehydrogenase accessory protein FdhE n=1 Tax=Dokdonella sp. TaxID=2291710 RepID=UPI003F813B8E
MTGPAMPQRILEPGQIESAGQRSTPRVRLPARERLFTRRAERLRERAQGHALADYLRLLAMVCDVQQQALGGFTPAPPSADRLARARKHAMPPLLATDWPRDPHWRGVVHAIAVALASARAPAAVGALGARLRDAPEAWLEAQADALLGVREDAIDVAAAPFLMAALQVLFVASTGAFTAADVSPLDVRTVCPLCGSAPVASVVAGQGAQAGQRFLHCALCATEWHRVRVQCTHCGAGGKDVAYRTLARGDAVDDVAAADAEAVRAETCDACRSYRKILYEERDTAVEPVADDLASLALDLLLAEEGYHRASGNPLLRQGGG